MLIVSCLKDVVIFQRLHNLFHGRTQGQALCMPESKICLTMRTSDW